MPRSSAPPPKQGFEIPVAAWLRGELRPLAEEVVLSPRAAGRGYLDPHRVRALWDRHQSGIGDHAAQLWALLVLELWHRAFIDQAPAAP